MERSSMLLVFGARIGTASAQTTGSRPPGVVRTRAFLGGADDCAQLAQHGTLV